MAKRVMIVDDDCDDLSTMKEVLGKEDYEIATARNGEEAFDLLTKKNYDLILIDIKMPTLTGYDLLRLMRKRMAHNAKMLYISIVPKSDVDMKDMRKLKEKKVP